MICPSRPNPRLQAPAPPGGCSFREIIAKTCKGVALALVRRRDLPMAAQVLRLGMGLASVQTHIVRARVRARIKLAAPALRLGLALTIRQARIVWVNARWLLKRGGAAVRFAISIAWHKARFAVKARSPRVWRKGGQR